MRRGSLDLLIAAVVAGISVAVVVFVPDTAVRTVFALPLLFVLPGLSMTAALFPSNQLDLPRRLLLQLGLSLSVAILGALVLDLTPFGLRRTSWAVLLGLIVCAGCAVAARRRTDLAPRMVRIWLPRRTDAALVGLAIAVVAGAVAFARTPLAAKNVVGYTALSILPARGSTGSRAVRVDISSGELHTIGYRLELYIGQRVTDVRQMRLAPGQEWQETFRLRSTRLTGRSWIGARLYRDDRPSVVYRSVRIRPGAAGGITGDAQHG